MCRKTDPFNIHSLLASVLLPTESNRTDSQSPTPAGLLPGSLRTTVVCKRCAQTCLAESPGNETTDGTIEFASDLKNKYEKELWFFMFFTVAALVFFCSVGVAHIRSTIARMQSNDLGERAMSRITTWTPG